MAANRLLIYAQDPGGSKYIIPVVSSLLKKDLIFSSRILVHKLSSSLFSYRQIEHTALENVIGGCPVSVDDWGNYLLENEITHIFCTTSSKYKDLTNGHLILAARKMNIPTLGIFDHWKGVDRFETDHGHGYCPDVLCCIDATAKNALTDAGIETSRLRITGHPYLETLKEKPNDPENDNTLRSVLLISQPRVADRSFESIFFNRIHGERWIDIIFDRVVKVSESIGKNIRLDIRFHPKENNQNLLPEGIGRSVHRDMDQAIDSYDVFIGKDSMALIEAQCTGKKCVCIHIQETDEDDFQLPFHFQCKVEDPEQLGAVLKNIINHSAEKRPVSKMGNSHFDGSIDRTVKVVEKFLSDNVRS